MASMYLDGEYRQNHPTWHAEDSPYKAKWISTILQRNHVSPQRVVEVGSGAGGVIRELQKLLPDSEFAGYEIIDSMYASAPQEYPNLPLRTKLMNIPRKITELFSIDL